MTGTFFLSSTGGGGFFNYRIIKAATIVLVPEEQLMVGYQSIEIEDTGELDVEGEVVIFD
jgi:hypothetical protein